MASTNGPDQILDAEDYYATDVWTPVKLRTREVGPKVWEPISVISIFEKTVQGSGADVTALAVKRPGDDEWTKWTFREYLDNVKTVAKAFIKLGLESRGGVTIIGFNSPEWFMTHMGAIFANGVPAGIYETNNVDACKYIATDCKANIAVVEDERQLAKFLQFRDKLPHLKVIIQYSGKPTVEGVLSWSELMDIGRMESDEELEKRKAESAINRCCMLVYTSGTTGMPKGVMLSQDNVTCNIRCVQDGYGFSHERNVSFLPLSHVAACLMDIHHTILVQSTVYFANKNALKGSLVETLKEVKPTLLLAVPRVWEKIYEKMMEVGRSTQGLKKKIGTWAKSTGLDINKKFISGELHHNESGWEYWLANWLVYSPVKANLGLDECKYFFSGAAPLSPTILEYFLSLDIRIMELYGMSELIANVGNTKEHQKLGTVGKLWRGMYGKVDNATGELCWNGRTVMMGYLNKPKQTMGTFQHDGWLMSGDIGTIDDDGFVTVTGRIKELLITAGGENVAPVIIEDAIKKELSCISNVMVVGDRRKFLSCILTFLVNINVKTNVPTTDLAQNAINWAQDIIGSKATTVLDLVSDQRVMKALEEGIKRANVNAISNAQHIQKFIVLETDFSIPGGEFSPTFKLKRHVVEKKYTDRINAIYEKADVTK
jgi:long-chain-fatty-acid--CoA ligase ACSBG